MGEKLFEIFSYSKTSVLLFSRLYFWLFLIIVFLFYSMVYNRKQLRNAYLFLVSVFFYWKAGGFFFILLLTTTFLDFFIGQKIFSETLKSKKKLWLSISIIVNLGFLIYFKYAYFFTDVFNSLVGTDLKTVNLLAELSNSGLGTHFDINKIILPAGISFYTFMSMSYVIDISKNKLKPVTNIFDYGFFVSFFPQILSGPITKASVLIPQIQSEYKLEKQEFNRAIFLIINGLFKKMIIADYISANFVNRIFESPASFTGFENLMAVYGYGIQIYCDFSGYTDIALGVALLLGFRLTINFNSPYKAENITDFWKRWHISLTTWFRDYLFLPLAYAISNRLSKQRYFYLKTDFIIYFFAGLITFIITGLWHGAAWRFAVWGGIHGLMLVGHRFWTLNIRKKIKKQIFGHFVAVFLTFNVVNFAWIFFNVRDIRFAWDMIGQIFNSFNFALIADVTVHYYPSFLLILFAYIIHWLPSTIKTKYQEYFYDSPVWIKISIAIIVVFLCYQAKSSEIQPFIYFQF